MTADLLPEFPLWYGGEFHAACSGEWFETRNPFTGKVWARVARGGVADAERAVTAAHAAFTGGEWPKLTASARGRLLHRLGALVLENVEALAQAEIRDNGKAISEMRNSMKTMAEWYFYYAGLADKVEGHVVPVDRADTLSYVVYEPLGVVAAILPWNSPLRLAAWKLAPALAAGNTMVVKPSEHTSTSIHVFARLVREAGFPPGVVNIVTGFGQEVVPALVAHRHTAKITFTGGENAGRAVNEMAARHLKPALLELGGKSPQIVFADADIGRAARGIAAGIFASGGQTCLAGSRVLVHEEILEKLLDALGDIASSLRLGDPAEAATHVGPVATSEQFDRIMGYIDIARNEGATVHTGAEMREIGGGRFVLPTILADVRPDMRIAQEEVFGPVLAVMSFTEERQAVEIANGTEYGLAAGIWTTELARAHRVAALVRSGTIWINGYRYTMPHSPFGGYKHSGIGRESGSDAMHEYLQTKSVWVDMAPSFPEPFR